MFKVLALSTLALAGFVNFSPPSSAEQSERAVCAPDYSLAARPTVAQAKKLVESSAAAGQGAKVDAITRLYVGIWRKPISSHSESWTPQEVLYVEGMESGGNAAPAHETDFEALFVRRGGRWEKHAQTRGKPVDHYRLELFFWHLTSLMPQSQ